MTLPAARILDTTAHGGAISVGTPLVLIGNKPAARIGDMHTCPMVTPAVVPVPHVGGPVLLGAFNVLVAGPPQARQSDLCLCVGPPDLVALGHVTTLVGMAGAFSGGLGGFLGLVVGGYLAGLQNVLGQYPRAVACPRDAQNPEGYYTEYREGIEIRGTAEFQQTTTTALQELEATRTGQRVLDDIGGSGNTVTIVETGDANGYCTADNAADAQRPGVGTDSTVQWNPNHHTTDPADPVAGRPGSLVILGHELIHASHNATGSNANGPYDSYPGQSGSSARGEERSTVGAGGTHVTQPDGTVGNVPDHSSDVPTENSLRDDLGIPRRPTYYPSTWPGGAPW